VYRKSHAFIYGAMLYPEKRLVPPQWAGLSSIRYGGYWIREMDEHRQAEESRRNLYFNIALLGFEVRARVVPDLQVRAGL
jgi:hypothetical protein